MRKYHYLVLFLIGFVVLWPFILHKLYIEQDKNAGFFAGWQEAENVMAEEAFLEEPQEDDAAKKEEETLQQEEPAEQEQAEEDEPVEEEPEEELPPEEFFQDTLFIGDSRTMGLVEYADLNNAVVFADTGMNIYRLYTLKNAVREQELYLEDILSAKQYRKIYLMLGINELGYDEKQTVKRYEEEVLKLHEKQPEAKIVLEANLHVTTARSERDAIFNNQSIDRINESIRQIAEKYDFAYIDVNEVFDDENGGLRAECTHDEVHVLGKYYQQWADWIRETGV